MTKKYLNVRAVCTRYGGVSSRTIDRWIEAGVLPEPIYIQKQRYWSEETLDERDESRATEAS
jgi:predicted DNA-binding transcriptional regulator AlpA